MKEKIKKFAKISNYKIIALCILIIIGIMYYYEDFREIKVEVPTKNVVVFIEDVPENTVIKKDMVIIEKKYVEDLQKEKDVATTYDEVIGKRTIVPIYKGETINNNRLLVNQDYMNDNENKKEISFQINEVDKALNINKGDFIDIWLEPIDVKNETLPQKIFEKLQVKEVVNTYKQAIDKNIEYSETEGKIASYLILLLSDSEIDTLYNVDKTLNNIKISKYKDNDFYKIIKQVIEEKPIEKNTDITEIIEKKEGEKN